MHILVTGSSGFVGGVLARRLVAAGHRVTALMRPGADAPQGCAVLSYSLSSADPLALPPGIDAIAHLAQSRSYRAFPGDTGEMFRVNVAGTQALLTAAAAAPVQAFCLVSSGTVYEPFDGPLVEERMLRPTSYLGASKLAAEIISQPFGVLFPISVLRLFGPYGPGQSGRLIPDLIDRVRGGIPVTLPAQGPGMRFAPTFVDDICDAILGALEGRWSGPFNVAMPGSLTIAEAVECIAAVVGRKPVFERKPIAAPAIVPDVTRLGARYDLSRFRSFADGIPATLAQRQKVEKVR